MDPMILLPAPISSIAGGLWSISIQDPDKLQNTVLHGTWLKSQGLPVPDSVPFYLNGEIQELPLKLPFSIRTIFNSKEEIVDTVADLPYAYNFLNDLVRGYYPRKEALLGEISKLIERTYYTTDMGWPGYMSKTLPGLERISVGEVGIDEKYLFQVFCEDRHNPQLINFLVNHSNISPRTKAALSSGDRSSRVTRNVVNEISGTTVYCVRFPISSSKSFYPYTLVVLKGSPSQGVYLNPEDLLKNMLGDCDGDWGMCMFAPCTVPNKESRSPRPWNQEIDFVVRNPISIEDVIKARDSKEPDLIGLSRSFDERGLYIGQLTYCYWLLTLQSINKKVFWRTPISEIDEYLGKRYSYLQISEDQKRTIYTVCVNQDIFTPLIEMVMDARKDEMEGGTLDSLAGRVLNTFYGKRDIRQLLQELEKLYIPDNSPFDETKFTETQYCNFYDILISLAVSEIVEFRGMQIERLVLQIVGSENPGIQLLASRYSITSVQDLLNTHLTTDKDFIAFLDETHIYTGG